MLLPSRRPWTRQPSGIRGLARDNPFSTLLTFCWFPGAGLNDLASQFQGTLTNTYSKGVYEDGEFCYFGNAAGAGISFGAVQPVSNQNNTTILVVTNAAAGTNNRGWAFNQRDPSTGARITLGLNEGVSGFASGGISFVKQNTTANTRGGSVSGALDGLWHTHAFSALSATSLLYARDGVSQSITGTTATGTFVNANQVTNIQSALTFSASGVGANLALVCVFPAGLTGIELEQLTSNPWQLFEPRRIWVPVTAAGGGLPTLSASTFVPGSITSSGWRPRVTATY